MSTRAYDRNGEKNRNRSVGYEYHDRETSSYPQEKFFKGTVKCFCSELFRMSGRKFSAVPVGVCDSTPSVVCTASFVPRASTEAAGDFAKAKAIAGLRPSFSAHVRWREHGTRPFPSRGFYGKEMGYGRRCMRLLEKNRICT